MSIDPILDENAQCVLRSLAAAAMVTGGALTPPEVEAFLREQVREFVDRQTSPSEHREGPGSR